MISKEMGDLGIGSHKVHFGVNELGLVTVFGKDVSLLPYWFQKILFPHNVTPEGGIGEELYMTQVRAWFVDSESPEKSVIESLLRLNSIAEKHHGSALLKDLPSQAELSRIAHRFYTGSLDEVCLMAKELNKIVVERLNREFLDSLLSEKQLAAAKGFGSIKRLALILDGLGQDGRAVTRPLVGIYDLRQGDAHIPSSDLRDALELFGIARDSLDYMGITLAMLTQTAASLGQISSVLESIPSSDRP
jgi:hypothetical protein